jgi:hypothetical protein
MVDSIDSPLQNLDTSAQRVEASISAGNQFTNTMESIRDSLDDQNSNTGTSLGAMVGASVETTEAETRFNVQKGLPSNVAKKVDDAAKKMGG